MRVQGMRAVQCKSLELKNILALWTHPIPNSSRFVFPATSAPAALSLSTIIASFGLKKPSKTFEAHVVGSSLVQILSFIAIKRPSNIDF